MMTARRPRAAMRPAPPIHHRDQPIALRQERLLLEKNGLARFTTETLLRTNYVSYFTIPAEQYRGRRPKYS
jgi:hypothetical protein